MKPGQRWNAPQIPPRRDSNTGGSDQWSNPLPSDHGGAPSDEWKAYTQLMMGVSVSRIRCFGSYVNVDATVLRTLPCTRWPFLGVLSLKWKTKHSSSVTPDSMQRFRIYLANHPGRLFTSRQLRPGPYLNPVLSLVGFCAIFFKH